MLGNCDELLPLLSVAHPELYRMNTFRVTGLHVSATEREVKRRLDKLEMSAKLSSNSVCEINGPLPLNVPLDSDAIQEARQRLGNPEKRFIDEFFWFWPADQENDDLAMIALCHADEARAEAYW